MPDLNERERLLVRTCRHCKYCAAPWWPVISKDNEVAFKYYYLCMLDSSEEDRKFVEQELSKMMRERGFTVQSESLFKMLQLDKSEPDFRNSPRCVSGMCRCQFYEPTGVFYDAEDVVKPLTVAVLSKPEKEKEQDE